MTPRKVIKGNKYGHLTAIRFVGVSQGNCAAIWNWRCDCGNEKEIEARVVTAGRTRTCGKCQLKHKLRRDSLFSTGKKNKQLNHAYQKYARRADRRGRKWLLSPSQFSELVYRDCQLCGEPHSGGELQIIEPLSNESNYTVDGVYVRCPRCEEVFGKVSLSLLIEQILEVHKHITSSN